MRISDWSSDVCSSDLQPGLQIDFHALHEGARESAQISDFSGVFARQDKPELVPVLLAAFGKGTRVGFVGVSAIGLAALALAGDAIAFDIAQAGGDSLRALLDLPDSRYDDPAPDAHRQGTIAQPSGPPALTRQQGRPGGRERG